MTGGFWMWALTAHISTSRFSFTSTFFPPLLGLSENLAPGSIPAAGPCGIEEIRRWRDAS
jgi:hypothetical protein